MNSTVAMDRAGRLVIPKALRASLHLENATAFHAEVVGGKLELTPVIPETPFHVVHKHGLPVIAKTGEEFSAAKAVRATRAERDTSLRRRVRSPRA